MNILVTGATGYIGGRLIPRLLQAGHRVRVLVRDPRRIAGRTWADEVEIATGDLLDAGSIARALDGIDVAYYLVHSMSAAKDFAATDRRAASNFVAAARGRVPRVIYLGGLVAAGPVSSEHLSSRAEVGEILRSELPALELRAGPIVGSGSASFEMIRYLTERLPAMVAPRWISNEVQPIGVGDVLQYLLSAIDRDETGVVEIGADPVTFKEMMQTYAEVRGLRRIIVPVPVLAPRLAGLWVGLVTPIYNRVAVPIIEGVVSPVLADTRRARAMFPGIVPVDYRTAVERALRTTLDGAVETRWSSALGSAPAFELRDVEGLIREIRTLRTNAAAEEVFRSFASIGGDRGWLVWEWAWKIRGLVDRLVGGPGLRRGRRHPGEVLVGEALDFWRVEACERPRMLRLRAEMKVPGAAWLQWETREEGGATLLIQTALFAPRGLSGALYWYLLYPIHGLIFSALARAVVADAERRGTTDAGPLDSKL
jgi:uncharacterized protein YbjT (DUF2867 family)